MDMAKIEFKNVDFTYQPGTPFEVRALRDINVSIADESYVAIVGHTGSGKSTFIQLLDGLLKPTKGTIVVDDQVISSESSTKDLAKLRRQIGLVFQFPESQLFEETVLKDIAFGPQNFGKSLDEANLLAHEALKLVGLDDSFAEKSPFDLSGGQMRRVAIAGVIAMRPQTLILDEPTAGLDPVGQFEMMELFNRLHKERHMNIVLITHQMDDAAKYSDQVIVMNHGTIVATDTAKSIFSNVKLLEDNHLNIPETTRFVSELAKKGVNLDDFPLNVEDLAKLIRTKLGGHDGVY